MTPQQIRDQLGRFRFWYHKIDLGHGVVTPGLPFDPIWDNIREARKAVEYRGRRVLDIASFDGMWAFEAEKLGAETVVATDCYYSTYKNFLFCRKILDSNVIPYYNVPPHELWNRLDVFLQENWDDEKPYDRLFDVVQHLGLLYHLRDPLLTLSQACSVVKTGGHLLIETAAVINQEGSFMLFNGTPPQDVDRGGRIFKDITTWWAPTIPCLKEMLRAALFEPIEETMHVMKGSIAGELARKIRSTVGSYFSEDERYVVSRVALIAKAVAAENVHKEYFRELARTYRNPYLVVEHLQSKK
jgi:tRNA (mo5U34)-methyltransferase